jgi:hypothetical protein
MPVGEEKKGTKRGESQLELTQHPRKISRSRSMESDGKLLFYAKHFCPLDDAYFLAELLQQRGLHKC